MTILHTGLPKAGSTFLQRHFFSKFTEHSYISSDKKLPQEFRFILKLNSQFDQLSTDRVKRIVSAPYQLRETETIKRRIRESLIRSGKELLLSSEGLCGVSYAPLRNNPEVSLLLHEIFGPAKVIFIFRKQSDFCESIYKQLVFTENRFKRFLHFDEMFSTEQRLDTLATLEEHNWHQCVQNYIRIFGKHNVLALPFEMLRFDLHKMVDLICQFLSYSPELPTNFYSLKERVSEKIVQRNFTRFFFSSRHESFSELDLQKKSAIDAYHRSSNQLLAELTGINLESYGYY
jgi:hypothetical protein